MKKIYYSWMRIEIISFLISSVSVLLLLIPTDNIESDKLPVSFAICGLLFWMGLIVGITMWTIVYLKLKKEKSFISEKNKMRPGIISFMKNKYARLADYMLGISFIGAVIGDVIIPYNRIYNCICICVLLFSFEMHCLLNGKIYNYIEKYRRKKNEEKN